jgi:pyrophosphatase PpaX
MAVQNSQSEIRNSKSPKAVLFDLDGTLINSIDHIVDCWQHTVRTCLGREITREEVVPTLGRALLETFEEIAPGRSEEMREVYRAHQKSTHDQAVTLPPGTREALEVLRSQGVRLGVVTSKGIVVAMEGLDLFDLAPYFDVFVTYEDTQRHKPNPDPLLVGLERLGLDASEVLYVGDAIHDVQAAHAAGMMAVGATWGAGTRETLQAAGADFIIDSYSQLPGVLQLVVASA